MKINIPRKISIQHNLRLKDFRNVYTVVRKVLKIFLWWYNDKYNDNLNFYRNYDHLNHFSTTFLVDCTYFVWSCDQLLLQFTTNHFKPIHKLLRTYWRCTCDFLMRIIKFLQKLWLGHFSKNFFHSFRCRSLKLWRAFTHILKICTFKIA